MELDTTHRLDPKARQLWHISGIFVGLIAAVGTAAMSVTLGAVLSEDYFESPVLGAVIGGVVALVPFVLIAGVMPALRWHAFRYRIEAERLFLQDGVLTVTRTLIPLVRVQNVDSSQGPLDRWFGLADITVSTAARTHRIPSLRQEVAEDLREGIARLVQAARDDA